MPKEHLFVMPVIVLVASFLTLLQAQDGSTESRIDEIFSKWNQEGLPGASVAVVNGGEVVFEKGYGMANLEYDISNEPNTIFHIASISKQFTVLAILLLQEEGKLNLDDEVSKFIPEMPNFGSKITLRHLATHTSGLRDQWNLLAMGGWQLDDVITKDHVLKLVKRQEELNFKPGDQYMYCNTGFTLLAEVVARVSKRTFAQFTQYEIFEPLGMSSTLFYDDHEKIVKNRAYSYTQSPFGLKKQVLSYANVGATSLFTTVQDLAKWVDNFKQPQVGSKELLKIMETRTILNDGDTIDGAMGQFVNDYHGHRQIQHGGADAGYRSYLGRFPEQELAVIVLGNIGQLNATGLALRLADLFLPKNDVTGLDARSIVSEIKPFEMSNITLKSYTGSYWNDNQKHVRKIYLNNDTLRYDRGNGFISPLVPIADDVFQMLRVSSELKIRFSGSDKDRIMEVTINGRNRTVSRIFEPMDNSLNVMAEYAGTYFSPELETSYRFTPRPGGLLATHSRLPDFTLKPSKTDVFSGNRWYFSLIEFQRNDVGEISGIRVSSDRVKNLLFKKMD